jgi:lupus La protein
MSTAELTNPEDSNAQAAQDVQNMLAELKGSKQPEVAPESAVAQNGDLAQASNDAKNTNEVEPNNSEGKNGVEDSANQKDDPEIKKDDKAEEGMKQKDAEVEGQKRPGGYRPYRGGDRGRAGGRGRGNFNSYKQNIKSDLTTLEETDDPVQIRKQVSLLVTPCTFASTHTPLLGRVLLLRLQSPHGQISSLSSWRQQELSR